MLGRQVHDHDEHHARAGGQRGEEGLERPDAAGGGANADDHEVIRGGGTCGRRGLHLFEGGTLALMIGFHMA